MTRYQRIPRSITNIRLSVLAASVLVFAACAAPISERLIKTKPTIENAVVVRHDTEMDNFVNDLQSQDENVRFRGSFGLLQMTRNEDSIDVKGVKRIKSAVPALVKALSDPNSIVCSNAAGALANFTMKEDISPVINDIEAALEKCSEAAWPLVAHYAKNGKWADVERLIKHPNEDVRSCALRELGNVAKNGIDISPVLNLLDSSLHNAPTNNEGLDTGSALIGALKNEKTRAEALRILINAIYQGNERAKFYAAFAITQAVEEGVDVPGMEGELKKLLDADIKMGDDALDQIAEALRELRNRRIEIKQDARPETQNQ